MKGQNFSFKPELIPMIILGRKIITNRIATPFRQKLEIGGIMHIFTGMRTQDCKKYGTAKVIDKGYWWKHQVPRLEQGDSGLYCPLFYDGERIKTWKDFAYVDGFDTFKEFYDFFMFREGKADELGFVSYKFEFSIERVI